MDQVSLVDRRIEDGQRLILRLAQDGIDVVAAFWLKAPDDAWPHLYIATALVDQSGPADAYRALQKSLGRLPGTTVSLADVKLIGVGNHITASVRHLIKKARNDLPFAVHGGQISNLAVEYAYFYSPPERLKPHTIELGKVRLKTDVAQTLRVDELVAPLTSQESHAFQQIVSSGVSPNQAEYWVRRKREAAKVGKSIPASTIVEARVAAWWGDSPDDDPNPLLEVTAPDGTRGLTFKNNTERVQ